MRITWRARAVIALLVVAPLDVSGGQAWNDARTMALVQRATDRRAQQLADSGLVDYQATAHGYLTFLAQLGEGFREPPQVVKADELALQVYWKSPNLSKEVVIGRRDSTLLPTDIHYHRDHLGIVQNNFPAIIRLGDGDEVRDVPHPLSGAGMSEYQFAITDSLRMMAPGRQINVYEVKVRPEDDKLPRIIGALYIDRDNAQVVRMAFSFTRAALLDDQLEDLFIVLENGLVGTRFWLPRHQEVEIRRTATWLDYPVRGIIRGRWEISDYQLNQNLPHQMFVGPEIVFAPEETQRAYQWPSARILDSLPADVRAITADEIKRVQTEVRELVRAQALRRPRSSVLAAASVSDFVRFNRVEGTALGGGVRFQFGRGFSVGGSGRYGFSDREVKGRVSTTWRNAAGTLVDVYASRDFRDVGDVAERSRLINSLAAQEFGSDYTDPYGVDVVGAALTMAMTRFVGTLDFVVEKHRPVAVRAQPAHGSFTPTVTGDTFTFRRVQLTIAQPTALAVGGLEMQSTTSIVLGRMAARTVPCIFPDGCDVGSRNVWRLSTNLAIERPIGASRFVARTIGAIVSGARETEEMDVFMGGTVTAPGYGFHSLRGTFGASQRLEFQTPVPFPAVSLGRFGRSGARATVAPFVVATAMDSPDLSFMVVDASATPTGTTSRRLLRNTGFYPSAGIGVLFFFDLLRVDVARGLNRGRWTFSIDVNPRFWSIL